MSAANPLPAGPYLKVEAGTDTAPVSLTILNQTITAHVWFQQVTTAQGTKVVGIGFDNTSLSFGAGSYGVAINNAAGALELLPGGIAGQLTGTPSINVPGFSITAAVSIEFNTTTQAVNDSLSYTGADGTAQSQSLVLDAGPYVRVQAGTASQPVNLTIAGFNALSGEFFFQYATTGTGTSVIEVGVANLTFGDSDGSILGARGALIVYGNGVAGVLLGTAGAGSSKFQLSASLGLKVNTTGGPVNQTVNFDGTTINVNFASGTPEVALVLQDVSLNLDNLLEIYGANFTIGSDGSFSGDGLQLFVGSGPYQTNGTPNPNAIGILIDQATVGFQLAPNSGEGAGLYALAASGQLKLVGLDGLTVQGTVTFQINTSGAAITAGTVSVPANTFLLTVTGVKITVGSVLEIDGALAITRAPNGTLTLAVTNASVAINVSGTPVFGIGGSASFTIDPINGFQMQSFSVNSFSLFGVGGLSAPSPGSGNSAGSSAALLFPTADLASPLNGAAVTGLQTDPTTHQQYIDITFNDVNGVGLNAASILDATPEFTIQINGQTNSNITINGTPTAVAGKPNTYRYTVMGFPTSTTGVVTVTFLPGSFSDNGGTLNAGSSEQFYLVATPGAAPPPIAVLANPSTGQPVTAASLNAGGYIEVTYQSLDGTAINQSLLGTAVPFTLSGTGLDGVQLTGGVPVIVGAPLMVSGSSATATSVTYRYYLQNSDSTGATPLFQDGTVTLTFTSHAFDTTGGTYNGTGLTQTFTISDSAPGGATTAKTISLGPISLQGPTIGIGNLGFKNGMLDVTISIGADRASLNFGGGSTTSSQQSASGVSVNLIGVVGTFDIQVDALGLLSGKFRVNLPGNFSLRVSSLTVSVPNVVNVVAQGIQISYDPAGGSHQQLVVIQSAAISFPSFNITGTIAPFQPATGPSVPGLVVYEDGFALGQAELDYGVSTSANNLTTTNGASAVSLGNILTFKDIRVGVENFSVTFGQSVNFNGSIFFASGGATFLPGKPISATITAAPGAQAVNGIPPEAMRLTLSFSNGQVSAFQFQVSQMAIQLGSYLTLSASNFSLNTAAGASDPLVSFGSVGAVVKVGSLEINGRANNFEFLGDGTFATLPGFGVVLSVGSATGGSFQWPSFLPIQINSIGITWPHITTDPADFTLTLSASVTGIQGLGGVTISGAVQGIQIDPALLVQGQFPIIGISSFGVTITGDLFGGQLDAGLVGGILRLDQGYNIIDPNDTTTPVAHRVFYVGIEGGFSVGGMAGFTIRLGLSQLGPLDVFVNVEVPGGILLDPDTGLTINNFAGGVEFYKTLPSINDPMALRNPEFGLPTQLTAAQWLSSLQQQVASQAKAQNGQANFFSAFTAPMTITGSAEIYSIYTSQALFNGVVTVMISTDGKFLISGKLNFANNNVSISGKLYADLSQVTSGKVTVLFLADVPDQVQLLTIYGKLQMGFENSSGQPVSFNVAAPAQSPAAASTSPGATVTDPAPGGGSVDVTVANTGLADSTGMPTTAAGGQTYIDITYSPASGANLAYGSVFNMPLSDITVTGLSGTVSLSAPIPMVTVTDGNNVLTVPLELNTSTHTVWHYAADGKTVVTVLSASSFSGGITDQQLFLDAMDVAGVHEFRYLLGSGVTFTPGLVSVQIAVGAFKNADVTDSSGNVTTGASNPAIHASFTVQGPTATIVNPGQGGTIDINLVNNRNWIDVVFDVPTGYQIDQASITNLTPKFSLAGPGLGTLALDLSQSPTLVAQTVASLTYRFWLTGTSASSGAITVTFLPNSWSYYLPSTDTLPTIGGVTIAEVPTGGVSSSDTTTPAPVGPTTVQVTIPDGAAAGLSGWTLDPTSLDISQIRFDAGTTGWTVTVDTTRKAVEIGTTNTFVIPITVTIPANTGVTRITVTVSFVSNSAMAFFGSPSGGGAVVSGDPTGSPLSAADFPANRTYLDVQFAPTAGATLNAAGILGGGAFSLSGVGSTRDHLRPDGLQPGHRAGQQHLPLPAQRLLLARAGHRELRPEHVVVDVVPGPAESSHLPEPRLHPDLHRHGCDRRPRSDHSGYQRSAGHGRLPVRWLDRLRRGQRPRLHRGHLHPDDRQQRRPGDDQRQRAADP